MSINDPKADHPTNEKHGGHTSIAYCQPSHHICVQYGSPSRTPLDVETAMRALGRIGRKEKYPGKRVLGFQPTQS